MEETVKVYLRFRPTSGPHADYEINDNSVRIDSPQPLKQIRGGNTTVTQATTYTFDRIFGIEATEEEINLHIVANALNYVMSGHNSLILCCGQTGGGKTYTMNGITLGFFDMIFQEIEKADEKMLYTIGLSYFQIYNDEVGDLLKVANQPIIRDSGVIEGLEKIYAGCKEDILEVLEIGSMNRKLADSKQYKMGSKSHTILRIEFSVDDGEIVCESTLFLVDLASPKKINRCFASIEEKLTIDPSFSALKSVINNLAAQGNEDPYRDSKLTRILQDSLAAHTKKFIIITCSPDSRYFNETVSFFQLLQRLKQVDNYVNKKDLIRKEPENWKSKYFDALNRIVEVEAQIESLLHLDRNCTDLCELKDENLIFKKDLSVLMSSFNDHTTKLGNTLPSSSLWALTSLRKELDVYKRLLVSKTDEILYLRSQINRNSNGDDITKELTSTIQRQNEDILVQIKRAEKQLWDSEEKYKLANDKWTERNQMVELEQLQIESKLTNLGERLRSIPKESKTQTSKGLNLSILKQ